MLVVNKEHALHNISNFSLVFIMGEDAFLLNELKQEIKQAYPCLHFSIEQDNEWQAIFNELDNYSLFSTTTNLYLDLHNLTINEQIKRKLAILQEKLITKQDNQNKVFISSSNITYSSLKTKWFKALAKDALVIRVWNIQNMPDFIRKYSAEHHVQLTTEAINYLSHMHANNTLACAQSLEKINLYYSSDKVLGIAEIRELIEDSSNYKIFDLIDTALNGNAQQSLKILEELTQEKTEPLLILSLIYQNCKELLSLRAKIKAGASINQALKQQNIWASRVDCVTKALTTLNSHTLNYLVMQCSILDKKFKSEQRSNAYQNIRGLIYSLTNNKKLFAL